MADRDLIDNLKQGRTAAAAGAASASGYILPVVATATVLGKAFDLQGYHGALVTFSIGIFGDVASGTVFVEAELQDSPDGTTYTAVADANTIYPPGDAARVGTVATGGVFFQSKTTAAADLSGVYSVGYIGLNRYLKVNVRFTSATNGCPISVVATAGFPDYAPVTGNPS